MAESDDSAPSTAVTVPTPPDYAVLRKQKKRRSRRGGPPIDVLPMKLEVVTSILGGAPRPRTVDDVEVIRGASLRGCLRFWWRALFCQDYDTATQLYEAECGLWGRPSTRDHSGRSPIEIRIQVETPHGNEEEVVAGGRDSYASWTGAAQAARPNKPAMGAARRRLPVTTFTITLIGSKEDLLQAQAALRAWVLFGGYGGRTRRGLGSLRPVDRSWLPAEPTRDGLVQVFGRDIFASPVHLRNQETPRLAGASLLVGAPTTYILVAWHAALGWLEEFRQKPSSGARRAPAISNWPEADKIRVFNSPPPPGKVWAHPPVHASAGGAWPRAGFGLPIIFHFRRDNIGPNQIEPEDTELGWEGPDGIFHDRLASPLVVKPLPLADGSYVPSALWFERSMPEDAVVGIVQSMPGGAPGKRVAPAMSAPFDTLVAPGDTPAFPPLLRARTLRDAFTRWLAAKHGVKVVAR